MKVKIFSSSSYKNQLHNLSVMEDDINKFLLTPHLNISFIKQSESEIDYCKSLTISIFYTESLISLVDEKKNEISTKKKKVECEKSPTGLHEYIPAPDSFELPYCRFCYKS